jgi:DNA-binding Xre family transcriptional regulator
MGVVRLRLSEVLVELGWTQKQLAEKSGISEHSISMLMRQPRAIRFETIEAICRATGKRPDELIVFED